VRENRAFLEAKIREEIPLPEELPLKFGGFKLPSEFVDEWMKGVKGAIAAFVAERVIDKIEGTIAEVATMPDHPIRAGFDQRLRVLATTLQEDPASAEKLRQWRDELLASEGWSRAVESAATTIRQGIENPAGTSGDWLHTSIQKGAAAAITHAIAQLRDADGWGGKLDVMVRDKLIEISLSQTTQVRILLENTVAKWPSNKMSDQLELELGADLQFVRLNGTLVGGLVGLVLHAIGIIFG